MGFVMTRHAHRFSVMVFVLLLACGLLCLQMFAQTTIKESDIRTAYAVGNQFSFYSDTSATPVSVGSASGTAQTWDFSALPYTPQGSGISIDPASAPQIAQFPDANIVTYSETPVPSGGTIAGYTYNQLTSSVLLFLGVGGDDALVTRNSPPLPAIQVPCTYTTTWNYQSDTNHIVPGLMWIVSTTNYTIDAFGTLRLPVGDYPALRMKNVSFTYSYNLFTGLSRTKSITYSFMTRGLAEVTVNIDTTQENLSTVVPESVIYTGSGTTDVNELVGGQIPGEFSLEQNYPNPFNPTSIIGYALPKQSYVTLRVYDMLGRVVQTIVEETQTPGLYEARVNASALASGIYFYRLSAGAFVETKKMIVLR
jgi:hypothetical protein